MGKLRRSDHSLYICPTSSRLRGQLKLPWPCVPLKKYWNWNSVLVASSLSHIKHMRVFLFIFLKIKTKNNNVQFPILLCSSPWITSLQTLKGSRQMQTKRTTQTSHQLLQHTKRRPQQKDWNQGHSLHLWTFLSIQLGRMWIPVSFRFLLEYNPMNLIRLTFE